jgi:hypothetical protein
MARRAIALVLLLAASSSLRGQGKSPRVDVTRPDPVVAGSGVATTVISGVLTEGSRKEPLHAGFTTAIHGTLELWRKGGFLGTYDRESVFEWDVLIDYSPATKTYHVRRVIDNRPHELGEVTTIEAAEQLVRQPYNPPLSPERSGSKYFYLFKAEVSTLSLSDLEAWQRWLKGEAQPAVQGKRNPVGAIQRGLGALLSRALGGDTQTYERRSSDFTAG